jgi:beta-N-acetylhexosaminidase
MSRVVGLALAGVAAALLSGCAALGFGGSEEDSASTAELARERAAELGDAQLVGQRLVAGFGGERVPKEIEGRIRTGRLAGVVLFSENFGGRSEARRLIRKLQSIPRPRALSDPLLVMIDQEGGQVKRLPGPPSLSAEEMGAQGPSTCRREGAKTGSMLRRTGVNVDLAPVLDVARTDGAIDQEDRSFGRDPAAVARCGGAFASALERHGVASTAKHFPGLGAAQVNTDAAVQTIDLSGAKLRRFDEKPFARFVRGGADDRLVMVSSAIYSAFSGRPAAFTQKLASGELRGRLGFEGVSITDALETASTEAFGGPTRSAVLAAKAGIDLMLFVDIGSAKRAAEPLRRLLRAGDAARQQFVGSVGRVLALRESLGD